jgi:Yip1 domain
MNLVDRAKNILLSPNTEWDIIRNESPTPSELFTGYAVILAAIPAVAGFIGYSLIGISLGGFGNIRLPIGTAITWTILTYILSLVGVYVLGLIIDALAPSFGSLKDLNSSLKISVYAYTATWVAGIFQIIPSLSFLTALASIYSLVLLYMGLKKVKLVPEDKMVGYFVVTIVVALVLYFVIGAIISSIVFRGYYTGGTI